jgi:ribosomal protein S18 acetylase RimI-like enzyme
MKTFKNIDFREMMMADYDDALALWRRMEGIGLSEADSRPNIEAFLLRNPGLSFVARNGAELAGAVLCGNDGRRGYLHHLAVSPEMRLSGIGKRLVEMCFEGLSRKGIRKCHIFVKTDNEEGRRFWRRVGWSDRSDILIMSRDVAP